MATMRNQGFTERRPGIGGRKLAVDILPEDRMAFRLMLEASQGYGLKGVRDWLQQRFSSMDTFILARRGNNDQKKHSALQGVITPETIPPFVIPGMPKPTTSKSAYELNNNDSDGPELPRSQSCFDYCYTKKRAERATEFQKSRTSSYGSCGDGGSEKSLSVDVDEDTNDDPGSWAAMSLPHLRTSTPYGFTTVLESPNTRRKESLLLGSANLEDLKKFSSSRSKLSQIGENEWSLKKSSTSLLVPTNPLLQASMRSLLSDTGSPSTSPPAAHTTDCKSSTLGRLYQRRRSSEPPANQDEGRSVDSLDSAGCLSFDLMSRSQTKEEAHLIAILGEIKLSLLYNKNTKSLRLLLIKAENLEKKTPRDKLSFVVKTCLMPNKEQKQDSRQIRGSHDPQFNEEFIFTDLSMTDIKKKSLRLRVCNKQSRSVYLVGEVLLPLESLGLEHEEEVRMWRDLEAKCHSKERGKLNMTVKFEPREDRVVVTVVEASDLPRCNLTGLPDTFVKVMVKQPGRPMITKQTRTRKDTSHPVFKETFVFTISPKVDDLRYTSVRVSVVQRGKLRSDTIVGEIKLGYGATEQEEYVFWATAVQNAGQDISHWHHLSPPIEDK